MVYSDLQFSRFVDIPRCDCQIGTARQGTKVYIFLIVNHTGPIYRRNALKDTYEKLDENDAEIIRSLVDGSHAPRYSVSSNN